MSSKTKAPARKPGASKVPAPAPKVGKSAASAAPKKETFHESHSHLFSANKRVFGVGRALPPKRDLSRLVKWPRYIRLQRQKAILQKRLKVPPSLNQFSRTLEKNQAANLFRLLAHYRPESREEKKKRLQAVAESEVKGTKSEPKASTKPLFIKYGLNHVTELIETKKAKLVVIAHDVDPIELVVWLPALCRKMNVPYCIVKGKARLGHLVYKKTVSAIAITEVRKEDASKLDQITQNVRVQFNEDAVARRKWGGGIMGMKANHVITQRNRLHAKEQADKL
jgi:large subunit ribosomal protein L7Ae